jgi:hypothetical protein
MMIEGDELKQFQMVCAITELSFRVSTGARLSRANLVTFCREMYGTTSKQHKPLLREMLGVWEQTYGTRFDMERAYENAGLTTEGEDK